MSIQTAIYNALAGDSTLADMLAPSAINAAKPAIYEEWAPEGTETPYINLTYTTVEGDHWAKRETTLYIDIFSSQGSTQAEAIKNRVLKTLDRQLIPLEDNHFARVHSDSDGMATEDAPTMSHWEVVFSVYYWRKNWIESS